MMTNMNATETSVSGGDAQANDISSGATSNDNRTTATADPSHSPGPPYLEEDTGFSISQFHIGDELVDLEVQIPVEDGCTAGIRNIQDPDHPGLSTSTPDHFAAYFAAEDGIDLFIPVAAVSPGAVSVPRTAAGGLPLKGLTNNRPKNPPTLPTNNTITKLRGLGKNQSPKIKSEISAPTEMRHRQGGDTNMHQHEHRHDKGGEKEEMKDEEMDDVWSQQDQNAAYDFEILTDVGPDASNGTGLVGLDDGLSPEHPTAAPANVMSGLVTAQMVSHGRSGTLMHAQEVGQDEMERRKRRSRKEMQYFSKVIFASFFFLCLIVAIAVGLVVRKEGAKTEPPESDTTSSPEALSSAPNISLNDFLQQLSRTTKDNINTPGTPQEQAYSWLASHWNITNLPEWRISQLFALATFYYSFEGPNWFGGNKKDYWMDQDKDECYWFSSDEGDFCGSQHFNDEAAVYSVGDPCNSHGEFQILNLRCMQLIGLSPSMPPEIALLTALSEIWLKSNKIDVSLLQLVSPLPQMTSLSHLDFSDNLLMGGIPSELGLMANVRNLTLNNNDLSSTIPTELGEMISMEQLNLNSNDLTGALPSALGGLSNMMILALEDNLLNGTIPTELGAMRGLTQINLEKNRLTGVLPSEFGMLPNLVYVALAYNKLNGTIPTELGELSALTDLYLQFNLLKGVVPSELGRLSNMVWLELVENDLEGTIPTHLGLLKSVTNLFLRSNNLKGPLPSEFGMLSKLKDLSISRNFLTGSLPTSLGMLTSLLELSGRENKLSGAIPSELGNATSLGALTLHTNKLNGTIPSELGHLTSMTSLELNKNRLTGPIPSEIGRLSNLERFLSIGNNALTGSLSTYLGMLTGLLQLHLHTNKFNGTVPTDLGHLTSMTSLELKSNKLAGPVPTEFGRMTRITSLSLAWNNLSGSIPSELGLLTDLQILTLDNNTFAGTIPKDLYQVVRPGSLTTLTLSNTGLSGTISDVFCSLGRFDSSTVGLYFDCDDQLCGCDWCACQPESLTLDAEFEFIRGNHS